MGAAPTSRFSFCSSGQSPSRCFVSSSSAPPRIWCFLSLLLFDRLFYTYSLDHLALGFSKCWQFPNLDRQHAHSSRLQTQRVTSSTASRHIQLHVAKQNLPLPPCPHIQSLDLPSTHLSYLRGCGIYPMPGLYRYFFNSRMDLLSP